MYRIKRSCGTNAREGDELETGAELYETATLHRDGRLLLVTGAIDEAAYVTDEDEPDA